MFVSTSFIKIKDTFIILQEVYLYTFSSFVRLNTPLDKNIRPPSKMKKKILFTIFKSQAKISGLPVGFLVPYLSNCR